jgi:hypothetical protein
MQAWLYDISDRLSNLEALLEAADVAGGEPDIKTAIANIYETEVPQAIYDGIGYLQAQKSLADDMKNEEKRIKAAREIVERRIERVKKGYMDFMEAVGERKVTTPRGTMTVVAPKATTIIDNAADIPTEYMRQTIKVEPDKESIKQAIQMGKKIPGAHLEMKTSLRIK